MDGLNVTSCRCSLQHKPHVRLVLGCWGSSYSWYVCWEIGDGLGCGFWHFSEGDGYGGGMTDFKRSWAACLGGPWGES